MPSRNNIFLADDKSAKVAAVASDGEFWISKVLSTIEQLENDSKHVSLLTELDEEETALHDKARETITELRKVFHIFLIARADVPNRFSGFK